MNNKSQNSKFKIQNNKNNTSILHFALCTLHSSLREAGFTLLEMLVVMAIITIITSVLWSNFFNSLAKGRDSRRKQDLELIAKGLELYYNDNKAYPTSLPSPGTAFTHPDNLSVIYMQKIPADPSYPGYTYCYPTTAAGADFKLYANLENQNDPKIIPTVACNSVNYNYGISSQNTTP